MRWLCLKLDAACHITDNEPPTVAELNDHYKSNVVQDLLPPLVTGNGRRRRRAEMGWDGTARQMKKRARQLAQQNNGNG